MKKSYKKRQLKKSRKKYSSYPLLITVLYILLLLGLGYVAYDAFFKNYFARESKKEDVKPIYSSNNVSNPVDSETDISDGVPETTSNAFVEQKESEEIKTNFINTNTNITEKKVKIQKFRVFMFKEINDNLVLYPEIYEERGDQDPVFLTFNKLKYLHSEGNKVTFVNPKVKLIDYKITPDKMLIINLSKDINYSGYGSEGILYSIYQIAYTLGNSVGSKEVLILIEGEEPKYLGGEGIMFENPIDISKPPKMVF